MGGAERLVVDLALFLNKKNIEIDILILKGGESPLLEKLNPTTNIQVFCLTQKGSVYNPIHIFRLKKYFEKYDIVHVHLFPALYWSALTKLFGGKKNKLIFTEHSSNNTRRRYWLLKYIDRKIYKRFDAIITISKAVDKNLKKHLGKKFKSRIHLIYNGIDVNTILDAEGYSKTEIDNLPEEARVILQVSTFRYPKDQKTVISAMKLLPKYVFLLLVGDGNLKQDCEKHAKDLKVDDRVIFLGLRTDVPKLLKTSDFIVLSSYYEGLSLSSIEGMASGSPFLATNVPGLTEVVENAGLLFQPKDHHALAKLIISLLEDPIFYGETVHKCINRAKEYDIDSMAVKYINLYNTL